MPVVVHVSPADLRDTPIREYAPVLANLVGEMFGTCPEVRAGDVTRVLVVDAEEGEGVDADVVLDLARQITRPDVRDGYFG